MTDDLVRLLDAIHAAPADDAPRLVYADALIERGDPRGDYIVRQCRGDTAESLFDPQWLEELGPLLMSFTFERGFLATARFAPGGERGAIERAIGSPIWGTVHALAGPLEIAVHPVMRALRVLETRGDADWRALLDGRPQPLETLIYVPSRIETQRAGLFGPVTEHVPEEIAALATCAGLPALSRLVLSMITFEALGVVLRGPIVDRVTLEWGSGPLVMSVSNATATIALAPSADPLVGLATDLIRLIPPHLAIELVLPPQYAYRAQLEHAAAARQ